MKLAEIYEITNETRRVLDLIYECVCLVNHSISNGSLWLQSLIRARSARRL